GGNVYIFSGKKLSARLGMMPTENPTPPVVTYAVLFRGGLINGTPVQQAPAGESNLVILINGTGFKTDVQVFVNGSLVVSDPIIDAPAGSTARVVFLDSNPAVLRTAGPLA